jgi:hypothetical protein
MFSIVVRGRRGALAAVSCAVLVGLSGCLGPTGLCKTRNQYNEAITRTNNEELLLNLVRLRYGESPNFLSVTGVTAQFEFDASTGFRAGIERSDTDGFGTGQLGFADRPTVSLSPQRSAAFTRALLTHISLDTLYLFATTGADVDALFRLFVREINGVEATGPESVEFRQVTGLINLLHQQRTVVLAAEQRQLDVPDAPPFESLTAPDLVKIKQAGYGARPLGEKKGYALTRTAPVHVVRVQPEARDAPEVLELMRLLQLRPGLPSYELEDAPQGQLRKPAAAEQRTRITLTTRSVLEVMYLLSQAVAVPDDHLCQGAAPVPRNPTAAPGGGLAVIDDLFHVQAAKCKPKGAAVAIKHRGWWFFIADADAASKATLRQFNELFRLERIGDAESGPVLTLPVGR